MNTERDRLRTLLPECERKMFADSAAKQIAAAKEGERANKRPSAYRAAHLGD